MAYAGGPDGSYAQYFLGNDMIVAPIVTPVDKKTRLAKKEVWLPKGTWIEKTSGRKYIIDETDVFFCFCFCFCFVFIFVFVFVFVFLGVLWTLSFILFFFRAKSSPTAMI